MVKKRSTAFLSWSRMSGLQVLKEQFAPRDFTPLPMDGGDWLRQGWVEVTIRLDRSVMDRVIERFGAEHIVQADEHNCWAIYPIIPNSLGYDRLLAFGDILQRPQPCGLVSMGRGGFCQSAI